MSESTLAGKSAVVTGGSRGIGRHIARALHEAGASVVITGRNETTLRQSAEQIGCHFVACDQRDPAAIDAMAARVRQDHGEPDILVNNAGLGRRAPVTEMSLEDWRTVLETNLTGVFLTTKAFLPGMIARERGDIFMISSMSGKRGDPGGCAYNASKFGLQGFAQAVNYDVRQHNIRVMVLNPSSVDTSDEPGAAHGHGVFLHAADLAATVVHLAALPGRTLVRDMDIWGTNPP